MPEMLPELQPNFFAGIIFPLAKKKVLFEDVCQYYILWDFYALLPLMLEAQL